MDVGAFVQENKRWLLGSALGFLVYWIASGVIASGYDVNGQRSQAQQKARASDELYDGRALEAAKQEQKELSRQLRGLRDELEFKPDPVYLLQGKAMAADDYLTKVGRDLRDRLQQQADARYVQLVDKGLGWPAATDPDGVRSVLFGLALLDQVAARLFLAHDQVRAADELAPGLLAITALTVVARNRQQAALRPSRAGAVDVRELLDEEKVDFQFQSDAPTATLFLERCRQPGQALVLENLSMVQGNKPGDPLVVKGSIRGIAFKEQKQ